jgi:hypothetical protein
MREQYISKLNPEGMQARKQRMLKELGADSLYYQTSVERNIQIATLYMFNSQYGEAQSALASSNTTDSVCRLAEHSAQVGIVQGNYGLVFSQEKRVDAFLSTAMSNEVYLKRLTVSEITSYWRVKWLILFAHFLKHNYEDMVKQAYELVNADPIQTNEETEIKALQILNNSDFNRFIHKDEILISLIISILMTRGAKSLNEIHTEPEFIALVGPLVPDFRPLFSSLNGARFSKFFEQLSGLDTLCTSNFIIARVWDEVRAGFRKKAYVLYLSLVKRVTTAHLSVKLGISEIVLRREINDMIRRDKLEFRFTEDETILEATKPDKKLVYYTKLNWLAEETDNIENNLRTAEQNKERPVQMRASSPELNEPKSYDPESLDARLSRYGR